MHNNFLYEKLLINFLFKIIRKFYFLIVFLFIKKKIFFLNFISENQITDISPLANIELLYVIYISIIVKFKNIFCKIKFK